MFVEPQLETIQSDGEDTILVEEVFLYWNNAIWWISKDFHALDYGYCSVRVIVDTLIEKKLSIKDETQILPQTFGC